MEGIKHTVGIAFVFLVALIWTIASFVSQKVVSDVDPFIFTYLGTTLFTFYLPLSVLGKCVKRIYRERRSRGYSSIESQHGLVEDDVASIDDHQEEQDAHDKAFNAALWVAPLWFMANWFYNVSFLSTSITSNTILSQTSALFTFALAVWLLREQYSNTKLLYVVLTILGVVLVTVKDYKENTASGGPERSVWGDAMCILGAGMYGLYSVTMRKRLGEEHEADLALFFGYVGLLTTAVLTPTIVLLLVVGVFRREHIMISRSDLALIALEGLIDNIIADFLLAKAVLLVGPTLAQLGMSSTIPMAAAGDILMGLYGSAPGPGSGTQPGSKGGLPAWVRKPKLLILTLMGTLLVVCGFFGFNKQPASNEEEEQRAGDRQGHAALGGLQMASPTASQHHPESPASSWQQLTPKTPGTAGTPKLALVMGQGKAD